MTLAKIWSGVQLRSNSIEELNCWAKNEDRAAAFALGMAYAEGTLVEKNDSKAVTLFEIAKQPTRDVRSYYSAPVGGDNYSTPVNIPISVKSKVARVAQKMIDELSGTTKVN